jgi:hypothetical protein
MLKLGNFNMRKIKYQLNSVEQCIANRLRGKYEELKIFRHLGRRLTSVRNIDAQEPIRKKSCRLPNK